MRLRSVNGSKHHEMHTGSRFKQSFFGGKEPELSILFLFRPCTQSKMKGNIQFYCRL